MAYPKISRRKGLKICCAVTTIVLMITFAVLVTLSFTVLKPKPPTITAHPVGLGDIAFNFTNIPQNVTIGFLVTIDNRNYGSFKFENTTSNVDYHGITIAEIPIEQQLVPARGQLSINTSADLMVTKLISSPSFFSDFEAGSLNMTSSATLPGKVSLFKIFKLHATAFSSCSISFFIQTRNVNTTCDSKIKL